MKTPDRRPLVKRSRPTAASAPPLSNPARDGLRDFLPERAFLKALCLERKRAERSRRLFVLMLVSPGSGSGNGTDRVFRQIISAVFSSTRETDVVGWYREHAELGVIFAELGAADKASVLTTLHTKVTAALQAYVPAEALPHVRISFRCFPDDWAKDGDHTTVTALYPDLVERDEARRRSRIVKRTMDITGSLLALVILAPLLLAIALAMKCSSPGPILFRQKRIGQHGRPFTFLKFRSMHVANDAAIHRDYVQRFIAGKAASDAAAENGHEVFKITNDPRVTRVGRFLRRTSLDELPQFFNVLAGEMSLVGPRPPIPYEVEAYDIWHRRRVLEVKPGITGLWQVSGRSKLRFDDMVRLDLAYAMTWSPWLDLKILLRTPRAVMSADGAY